MSQPTKPTLTHPIKTVATMLNMTERRIKLFEQNTNANFARVARGAVSARAFSPKDIFDLAAYKREQGEGFKLEKPITAVVFLPKGGVAKSTLTTELAVQFQLAGLKCLVVDLDPQASASFILGYDPEAELDTAEQYGFAEEEIITHTFADLLDFREIHGAAPSVDLSKVIKKPYGENGPHLIPADVSLSSLNYKLFQANNRDYRIRSWIARGRTTPDAHLDLSSYDIILFDCAPATSVVSRAALVAADFCISPIRLDALSAKSISFIASELTLLSESQLPFPEIIAVPTFYSVNTSRSNLITQGLFANYSEVMVQSRVRTSEIFPKSLLMATPRERMPISLRHPMDDVVRQDLMGVSTEVLARMKALS